MNRFTTLFIFFILPSLFCGGQDKVSSLLFEETFHDFGTAKEDGGELTYEFNFVNRSAETVTIDRISTLCKCTMGYPSSRIIPPGTEEKIKVVFNPYGYTGPINKGVTLRTTSGEEYKLLIAADLIPRKKSVEEEYPVLLSPGLRIDRTDFNFQTLPSGQSKTMSLRFANVSGRALRLKTAARPGGGLLSASAPKTVEAGETGEIVLTCNAAGAAPGFGKDSFALSAGGEELVITAVYAVTDDFSSVTDGAPVPVMRFSDTYLNAGTLAAGSALKNVGYTVRNIGSAPLHIRGVECPEGLSVTLSAGDTVAPGDSRKFFIILDPSRFAEGSVFETVRILADDPVAPVKELMLAARIAPR